MSHGVIVYAGNEYVFAKRPIALALSFERAVGDMRTRASNGNFYDSDPLPEYNAPG